jgi:hypothetical protein
VPDVAVARATYTAAAAVVSSKSVVSIERVTIDRAHMPTPMSKSDSPAR